MKDIKLDNFIKSNLLLFYDKRLKKLQNINKTEDKTDYLKICGQSFWRLITGRENFYLEIIEPLSKAAKQKNDEFEEAYARLVNKFTKEFLETFATDKDEINWPAVVKFNSGQN